MRSQQILDHYRDVVHWEHKQVSDDSAIVQRGAMLPWIGGVVQDADRFRSIACFPEVPRQSHTLAKKTFMALARGGDDSCSGMVIGEYASRYVFPLAGIATRTDNVSGTIGRIDIDNDFDACPKAEPTFDAARRQVQRTAAGRDSKIHGRVSVYHDAHGKPVAFRKEHDESSALLLSPVEITDTTIIPRGTIVRLERGASDPERQTGSYRPFRSDSYSYATFALRANFVLEPLRLSAWAYSDEADRALYAVEPVHNQLLYDSDRSRLVRRTTLEDFHEAAEQVMQICGAAA